MVSALSRLSVGTIVMYFLIYLICHIILGVMRNKAKKELEANNTVDTQKKFNILNKVFKFFPMVYVIFLIFALGT